MSKHSDLLGATVKGPSCAPDTFLLSPVDYTTTVNTIYELRNRPHVSPTVRHVEASQVLDLLSRSSRFDYILLPAF